MAFRIAIGRCNCQPPYSDGMEEFVCKALHEKLTVWRSRLPTDVGAVPTESFEEEIVEAHRVTFGTYRLAIREGETLVVFQALIHTWRRPNFLSLAAVGKLYAEGLLIRNDGTVEAAPNDVMWQFR